MAVTGLYLYRPGVYNVAETLSVSDRGELEITDLNNHYCRNNKMLATTITNHWSDMGVPESIVCTQKFIQETGFTLQFPLFEG